MKVNHSISRGSAKRGLAPASILHFRIDEDIDATHYIDSTVDDTRVAKADLEAGAIPYSIQNNGGQGRHDSVTGSLLTDYVVNSGYLVLYSCAHWRESAHVLFNIFESGDDVKPHHVVELVNDTVAFTLANNTTELLAGNKSIKNYYIDDAFSNYDVFGYCIVLPFDGTPAVAYLSNGDAVTYKALQLSNWDLTNIETGIQDADGLTMGLLHIADKPATEDAFECANWHVINAPKGNKDVCPVWNKYAADTSSIELNIPTNFKVSIVEETALTVKWTAPSQGDATGYHLYNGSTELKEIASWGDTQTTLTGLTANTPYTELHIKTYRNTKDSDSSNVVSQTTAAAGAGELPIASTGFTTVEGMDVILTRIFNNTGVDRTGLKIGLFANASGLGVNSVLANITPVTGTGYAAQTFTDATWDITTGDASYERIIFTASGADWDDVYGYYIYTTGTNPKLVHVNVSGQAIEIANGEEYGVDHNTNLTGGTNGITTTDGIDMFLNLFYKDTATNRGSAMGMGLYTNSAALDENTVLEDITNPSATFNYSDKAILDNTWLISGVSATYEEQTFTAIGGDFSAPIYGYDIYSDAATDKLLHADLYSGAPVTVVDGDSYKVTTTVIGNSSGVPTEFPLVAPLLSGTLAFTTATEGVPYSYDASAIFTGDAADGYVLETGTMSNGLIFTPATGVFSGTPLATGDIVGLSVSAWNGAGSSGPSNTDTLTTQAAASWQLATGHYENFVPWTATTYASQDAADTAPYAIYPRPDSETGANSRHKWAHGSMDYEIPIHLRAGAFPYHYEVDLTNTHTDIKNAIVLGANFDSTNAYVLNIPQATIATLVTGVDYDIVIKATDQAGKELKIWWSFQKENAVLSHFMFVDNSYANGSNDGSFSAPYTGLTDTINGTTNTFSGTGVNSDGLILVIKEGDSQATKYTKDNNWLSSTTAFWDGIINDPSDTNLPIIDLNGTYVLGGLPGALWRNDYTIYGVTGYNGDNDAATEGYGAFFRFFGAAHERLTVSHIKLDTVSAWAGGTPNCGVITLAQGARVHVAICDVEITNIVGSGASDNNGGALMLMGAKWGIFDNWNVHDFGTGSTAPYVIYQKHNYTDTTIRRIIAYDTVNIDANFIKSNDQDAETYNGENLEYCYCSTYGAAFNKHRISDLQANATPTKNGPTYFYRNTINGSQQVSNSDVVVTEWKGNVSTVADNFGDAVNLVETQPNYDDATTGLGSGSFEIDNTLTDAWYTANSETRGTVGDEII